MLIFNCNMRNNFKSFFYLKLTALLNPKTIIIIKKGAECTTKMVTALEQPQSLGKNYVKCKHDTNDDSTPYTVHYTYLVCTLAEKEATHSTQNKLIP